MSRRASPFSPRVMLGLVLFGALSFLTLLWMIGSGMDEPSAGATGAHANGKAQYNQNQFQVVHWFPRC